MFKILNKKRKINRYEEIETFFNSYQKNNKQRVFLPSSIKELEETIKFVKRDMK